MLMPSARSMLSSLSSAHADGPQVAVIVIAGGLYAGFVGVLCFDIRHDGAGPSPVGKGLQVHEGLEGGARAARGAQAVYLPAVLLTRIRRGQRYQQLTAAVVDDNNSSLPGVVPVQQLQLLQGNVRHAAVQGGILREGARAAVAHGGGAQAVRKHAQGSIRACPQVVEDAIAAA